MATQKPISTISYNTELFLKEKLDAWVKSHAIQAYQYICHKGEDGDKDHIHVRIEPNKKLDPMDLMEELREYPAGCDKPLGCRPFRPSKEEDWILYAVHDEKYLKTKYIEDAKEKLPYKWQDIKVSEMYDMETAFIRAKSKLEHTSANVASRIQKGEKPLALIQEGENPYLVNSLMHAIASTDYSRLQDEYKELQLKYHGVLSALRDLDMEVAEIDGKPVIVSAGSEI